MRRTWRITIEVLIVLAVAGIIAIVITWPVAADIGGRVPGGGPSSDVTGYLWDIWNNRTNGLDLWGPSVQDAIGFPFGRPGVGGANVTLFVFTGPAWILAGFMSAAATMNLLTLAGLALSGAAMYLLIRWLGLGRGPAAWAALAYEIAPYMFLRAGAHPPLVHIEFAPLLLMALVAWVRRPAWRTAMLVALAVAFAWLSNPYYGAMALVSAGIAIVIGVIALARSGPARAAWAGLAQVVGTLAVIVIAPLLILFAANGSSSEILHRSSRELDDYGTRIWDYIIPPPGNQLVEGVTGDAALNRVFSPGGERTVFLGWLVISLAIAGAVLAWRRRRALDPRTRTAALVTLPVLLITGLLSMASPTRVLGVNIPMPSSLVYQVLPFLRVYARFGVMVLACALVLAAIALSLLLRNRSTLFHHCVIAAALVITAVEMPTGFGIGSGPPVLVNGRPAEQVPTWQWLRALDDQSPVIETPAFTTEDLDRLYMYGQTLHGHPLANGGLNERSAPADFTEEFGNPIFPRAATAYATAGIRHVMVEPWAAAMLGIAAPDPAHPPAGLGVEKIFPDGSAAWAVTARPAPAAFFPVRADWGQPVTINGTRWRYAHASATMRAYAPTATRVTISIPARGRDAAVAYPVTITGPTGDIHRFTVHGATTLRMRTALPAGLSTLQVVATTAGGTKMLLVQMGQWQAST